MFNNFFARRPLFYAALVFCLIILGARYFLPNLYYRVPANDISQRASDRATPGVLRGVIISDAEERHNAYHEKYVSFILRCQSFADEFGETGQARGKVRVTVKEPAVVFEQGSMVELEGDLELPRGRRNPGGFNYREYLDRRGIGALFYCNKHARYRILDRPRFPLIGLASRARGFLSKNLSEGFAEEDAAFLKALLLGERTDVSAEFEDLFIRTGTLHILAVSGFNVGFLSAVILFLLAPFPLKKDLRLGFVMVMIWFYCLVVGWQAPLFRASVMATVLIWGRLLGRKADLLNSLGLAAIIILAINPKTFFDIGFQLSFAAVAGLALYMPQFVAKQDLLPQERLTLRYKISLYARELFWVSFVATFVTLPLTVQNFYIVTPSSLLANMIVVPLSFLLFFCGIVYFLTFWWVPKAVLLIPAAMKFLMQIFTCSLSWIGDMPLSCLTVGRLSAPLAFLLTVGIFYFFIDTRVRGGVTRAALIFVFSLNIFLIQEIARHQPRPFQMTVLDVGQADAIYFDLPRGGNLLVDAGRSDGSDQARRTVVPFLRYKGVRGIDAVVISHPQSDHIGGMSAVLKTVRARHVLDAKKPYDSGLYRSLKKEIAYEKSPYWRVSTGDSIEGFVDTSIKILSPGKDISSKQINNDSLVLKIDYQNTSFLLTGDIGGPAIRSILDSGADIKADVLKVSHHGGKLDKNEFEFIQEVAPKFSVISVGRRNIFGQPRKETIEALSSVKGNHIARTDELGAVSYISDGENVNLSRF